jgi:hypothetical protein
MRQKVFAEYGIRNARPDDYEIDYLIAPGLGGLEDIHNLWPQPSKAEGWNAFVKDDLEERLHQMVCSGQLDLWTAQRDIAADWIAAYKKYFHTDTPLSLHSRLGAAASFGLPMRSRERNLKTFRPERTPHSMQVKVNARTPRHRPPFTAFAD